MNRLLATVAALGTASISLAGPLEDAREALDNGFPQVALVKLEQSQPDLGKISSSASACLLYAQALFESNQPEAAIQFLESSEIPLGPAGLFWMAQSRAANGEWSTALEAYNQCLAQTNFPLQSNNIGREYISTETSNG